MGPRYKVTGCARFFVFFILFVPAVFFGAAYIRGENGVQILKDFYHSLVGKGNAERQDQDSSGDTMSVGELQKKLKDAEQEIRDLKRQLEEKEDEIEKLKSASAPKK